MDDVFQCVAQLRSEKMKRYQNGEVMLVMMIVVLVAIGLSGGHMGMMGHGNPAPDKSSSSSDQKEGASEHRH